MKVISPEATEAYINLFKDHVRIHDGRELDPFTHAFVTMVVDNRCFMFEGKMIGIMMEIKNRPKSAIVIAHYNLKKEEVN